MADFNRNTAHAFDKERIIIVPFPSALAQERDDQSLRHAIDEYDDDNSDPLADDREPWFDDDDIDELHDETGDDYANYRNASDALGADLQCERDHDEHIEAMRDLAWESDNFNG